MKLVLLAVAALIAGCGATPRPAVESMCEHRGSLVRAMAARDTCPRPEEVAVLLALDALYVCLEDRATRGVTSTVTQLDIEKATDAIVDFTLDPCRLTSSVEARALMRTIAAGYSNDE